MCGQFFRGFCPGMVRDVAYWQIREHLPFRDGAAGEGEYRPSHALCHRDRPRRAQPLPGFAREFPIVSSNRPPSADGIHFLFHTPKATIFPVDGMQF
jgi:hypothetical protein